MLVVAACDMNGDDDAVDDIPDDTTTAPLDDDPADDEDMVVPEDDDAVEPADDDAVGIDEQDDAPVEQDDEMAVDDEVVIDPEDEEAVDPEDLQPGEDQGMFFDLTVAEADELTEFSLREPDSIPENVEMQTIMGMGSMEAEPEEMGDEAVTVTFAYAQPPEEEMMQGLPVEFTQSSEIDMSEGLPEETDQEQVTIGDRDVTRIQVIDEASGQEVLGYLWQEDGIYFSLLAILGDDLSESELEDMIASIPAG